MIRTLISLETEDKRWLDRTARRRGVTMARLVREAVLEYRKKTLVDEPSMDRLLESTRGIWRKGDGLAYQRNSRSEWDR